MPLWVKMNIKVKNSHTELVLVQNIIESEALYLEQDYYMLIKE